jgi:hypothetical protein
MIFVPPRQLWQYCCTSRCPLFGNGTSTAESVATPIFHDVSNCVDIAIYLFRHKLVSYIKVCQWIPNLSHINPLRTRDKLLHQEILIFFPRLVSGPLRGVFHLPHVFYTTARPTRGWPRKMLVYRKNKSAIHLHVMPVMKCGCVFWEFAKRKLAT